MYCSNICMLWQLRTRNLDACGEHPLFICPQFSVRQTACPLKPSVNIPSSWSLFLILPTGLSHSFPRARPYGYFLIVGIALCCNNWYMSLPLRCTPRFLKGDSVSSFFNPQQVANVQHVEYINKHNKIFDCITWFRHRVMCHFIFFNPHDTFMSPVVITFYRWGNSD